MRPVKENRNIIRYLIFSLLTYGIYGMFFHSRLAKDMNVMCAGDGKKTRGFWLFSLFSLLTLGIYSFVWIHKLGNRMFDYCMRNGIPCAVNGKQLLTLSLLGIFLCNLPTLYALHLTFSTMNVMAYYHNTHP